MPVAVRSFSTNEDVAETGEGPAEKVPHVRSASLAVLPLWDEKFGEGTMNSIVGRAFALHDPGSIPSIPYY